MIVYIHTYIHTSICLVIEQLAYHHLGFVGAVVTIQTLQGLFRSLVVHSNLQHVITASGPPMFDLRSQARMDNPSLLRFLVTNLSWEEIGSPTTCALKSR